MRAMKRRGQAPTATLCMSLLLLCITALGRGSVLVSFTIDFNEKFKEHSVPHVKKAVPLPEPVRDELDTGTLLLLLLLLFLLVAVLVVCSCFFILLWWQSAAMRGEG